jgi:hypothetical protein
MKKPTACFRLLFGFALMEIAVTGCKTTSTTEVPLSYTVVEKMGDARCFEGYSEVPHDLKVGDRISQGMVIQTASGWGNWVGLMLDTPLKPATPAHSQSRLAADKMRLYENSYLKIEKLTGRTVKGKKIGDTRLVLSAGSLFCDIGTPWPTRIHDDSYGPPGPRMESIQPRPDASYFEIKGNNIVVHAEHAVLWFSHSGIARVIQGSVGLELPSTGATKDLLSGQQYDANSDQVSQIEPFRGTDEWPTSPPFWDWVWPRKPQSDSNVPQRLF